MKENSVQAKVKEYLKNMEPLTVVTLDKLYMLPSITADQRHSVRAAIYGLCAGTPVSERNKPKLYYGIRLKLNNSRQVIFSLPGIPREDLINDHKYNTNIERIIKRLQEKYGKEVINYWGKSAQRRSVDQANKGMKKAKKRDGNSCLLCKIEGSQNKKPVSACHIISRKTLFWKAIDEVEKINNSIFSEVATIQLQKKLCNDDLHSDSMYIVTLCGEHNDILLKSLSQSLSQQESDSEAEKETLLFDI